MGHRNTIFGLVPLLFLTGWGALWSQGDEHLPIVLSASLDGGYYESELYVELVSSPGVTIHYTVNGSRPTKSSPVYSGPIHLVKTTPLRAIAFQGNYSSKPIGHTYLINEPATSLPTVCISIPAWILFDPDKGLFNKGPGANDSILRQPGANFWSRREMYVHTEIFDEHGESVYSSPLGMRLFGGMSRIFPQKSLTLVARDRYGQKKIRYPIFGQDGPRKFKYLVLRNSGSDWGKSHIRDAFFTSLLDGWDIEKQDYRPAQVYINGQYWGLYNIREKINKFFLEEHAEVDSDSIDYLEHHMTLKAGNRYHYQRLRRFLLEQDMGSPEHYSWVKEQMEVDNFIDLQVAQIYFDNRDAGGNIRFWRPRRQGGRWRWIIYDTDMGFGLHDPNAVAFNSLAFHTDPAGPDWPNPPWSTFLLRKLLENDAFRHRFINRFCDHLNTSFKEEHVVQQLQDMVAVIRPEIGRHHQKWDLSPEFWEMHIRRMQKFGIQRPNRVRRFLREKFGLSEPEALTLITGEGGKIKLNSHLALATGRFEGLYFPDIPVTLAAQPQFGYRFSHWEHLGKKNSPDKIVIQPGPGSPIYKAVFEPYKHPLDGKLVINEVGPNNPNRKGGDWIEIYNSTNRRVSLEGWTLSDGNHQFTFPKVSVPPKDYLVVCEDSVSMRQNYPQAFRVIGGLNFGINKRKEHLALYNEFRAGIDSVAYQLIPSDSIFSLSLLLPYLDNSDQENWQIMLGGGTPGYANPYYLESRLVARQHAWLRVGVAIVTLIFCVIILRLRTLERL